MPCSTVSSLREAQDLVQRLRVALAADQLYVHVHVTGTNWGLEVPITGLGPMILDSDSAVVVVHVTTTTDKLREVLDG